jgi:uncharacterized protein YxeA
MKKILVVMILFVLLLTGCGKTTEYQKSTQESDMFVYIQKADTFNGRFYDVVYQRDTKVMYTVSHNTYNQGSFTLLVNPDGSPMLYKGE